MDEPPRRSDLDRGRVFEYLGDRNAELERWDASARALERGAELQPSPRLLFMWATAEGMRGNREQSEHVYRMLVDRDPGNQSGWEGLAYMAAALGDSAELRRANEALARFAHRRVTR
jgi:tetratricopeptide (TPR) repeat protein